MTDITTMTRIELILQNGQDFGCIYSIEYYTRKYGIDKDEIIKYITSKAEDVIIERNRTLYRVNYEDSTVILLRLTTSQVISYFIVFSVGKQSFLKN